MFLCFLILFDNIIPDIISFVRIFYTYIQTYITFLLFIVYYNIYTHTHIYMLLFYIYIYIYIYIKKIYIYIYVCVCIYRTVLKG